jgi:diacylglycerol O-acyltransferase
MGAPDSAYMGASDAFSWYMERDPVLRSSIIVVIWLDRAPDRDVLAGRIDRISRLMPSLRQCVIDSPLPFVAPRWIYDPHFDLNWHLRRIGAPEPRTRDVVLELARQSAMDTFDRARPLWELTLVEGLQSGEAALIGKIHHSLSDGAGGMRMMSVFTDLQREPSELGEMPPAPRGEQRDRLALAVGAAGEMAAQLTRLGWRAAGAAVPALLRCARDPVGAAGGTVAMARSVYRTAAPSSGAMSPLMRERATTRYLATIEVSLDALKTAAKTAGGTVNDAYLAAVTGGLSRYHWHHGEPVESLRAVVPISLRTGGDRSWGNKITLQRLTLPVAEPDPATRMREAHRITEVARKEPSLPVTGLIAGTLNLLPATWAGYSSTSTSWRAT